MVVIDSAYQLYFDYLGGRSFEAIEDFFRRGEQTQRNVLVKKGELPGGSLGSIEVFYKQYLYHSAELAFWGRRSKALCEYDNYRVFQRLQIPCADAIAAGERRDSLGRLKSAFILTRAIPNSVTLKEFFQRHLSGKPLLEQQFLRSEILRQLSQMTRRIHQAGFFHHDLVWRNILVSRKPDGTPQLWWIDCPRGAFCRWSWLQARRRIRDLASLDKSAAFAGRRSERLRFLLHYLEKQKLDEEARQLAQKVFEYRKERWMEDLTEWETRRVHEDRGTDRRLRARQ